MTACLPQHSEWNNAEKRNQTRVLHMCVFLHQGTERMIHVSVDGGEHWNTAQLPTVNIQQFYSILTATQDMIFMHVDDPGGQRSWLRC